MLGHVSFNVLTEIQGRAPPKGPNVMASFQQNAVFEPISNSSAVVLDAGRQLICCQVCACRHFSLLLVNGTIRMSKEHVNCFFSILNDIYSNKCLRKVFYVILNDIFLWRVF